MARMAVLLALALALARGAAGFDAHKMKKCEDNSFCRRHRAFAAEEGKSPEARGGAYAADGSTFELDAEGARVVVASATHKVPLELCVSALPGGLTARVRLRELEPLRRRFEPPYVLLDAARETTPLTVVREEAGGVTLALGAGPRAGQLRLDFSPLRLRFFAPVDGGAPGDLVEVASFNARGLLEFEHYRSRAEGRAEGKAEDKAETPAAADGGAADSDADADADAGASAPDAAVAAAAAPANDGSTDDSWATDLVWEESFQTHRDSRPFGPAAIGLDWTLPGFEHVYGLPERAAPLNLKNTRCARACARARAARPAARPAVPASFSSRAARRAPHDVRHSTPHARSFGGGGFGADAGGAPFAPARALRAAPRAPRAQGRRRLRRAVPPV